MVRGMFKSSRFRKVKRKVPGGQTVTRYLERKPKVAHCAVTGEVLHGIPRMGRSEAKNAPKTAKRPQRPFGGVLGSTAMRTRLVVGARALELKGKKGDALFQVGRLCVKIAGRDAGRTCVVIGIAGDKAEIDGETRRRTCSLKHLEPLSSCIDIKKGASRDEVKKAFAKIGMELRDTKPRKTAPRPRNVRKKKSAPTEKPVRVQKKAKASLEEAAGDDAAAPKATPAPKAAKPKAAPKAEKPQ